MKQNSKFGMKAYCNMYLCLHITKPSPYHRSKVIGAGIYDTPNPKMNSGIKCLVIVSMHGITEEIAERKLLKHLKNVNLMYADFNE